MTNNKFNIRVYGILINEKDQVLVTDEYRAGLMFTKFPGGGLEFGEGTIDCLKRECMEELHQEVGVMVHFYTTDYFQRSAFDPSEQLISIYYRIQTKQPLTVEIKSEKFDFDKRIEGAQIFRWVPLKELTPEAFKFPVDKKVAGMLNSLYSRR